MKPHQYKDIPTLASTVAKEGEFIVTNDLMFYADIFRRNSNGEVIRIEVEIHADWDGVGEAARVHQQTDMLDGTAVLADACIVLCPEEDFEDDITDWRRECISVDEEAKCEAAECEREFFREARQMGIGR